MKQQVYAAQCKDDTLRLKSSSGGVFSVLAEAVLETGGVVFGVAVTEGMEICHIAVETREALSQLRGSKYVRSRLGDSYKQAKEYLETGKAVLFTGTPCQIGGLKVYLDKDYVNLLCVDLACHGSPMERVWKCYVNYREQQAGSKAVMVNFRDKVTGWEAYSLTMEFENGSTYTARVDRDPYMKAFLQDLSLGKSCYNCSFKGLERQADITLADLWGASGSCPQLYDRKGTSAVFVHTEKGKALWEEVQDKLTTVPITADAVILSNPALIKSAPEPRKRKAFLESLAKMDFDKAAETYCSRPSLPRRLLRRIKCALSRLIH